VARFIDFISSNRRVFAIGTFAIVYPLCGAVVVETLDHFCPTVFSEHDRLGPLLELVILLLPVLIGFLWLPIRAPLMLISSIVGICILYLPVMGYLTLIFALHIRPYIDPNSIPF
jgi:hypothetical protein